MRNEQLTPLLIVLLTMGACATTGTDGSGTASSDAPTTRTELLEDVQARGKYLVTVLGCGDCHSPKVIGPQGPVPDPERQFGGHPASEQLPPIPTNASGWVLFSMGQTATVGPWGTSFAANITGDDTGIGSWSEEQFERALRQGWAKGIEGTRKLLPPMPWPGYASLTDADVHAIYTYLVSLPAVDNIVPLAIPPTKEG